MIGSRKLVAALVPPVDVVALLVLRPDAPALARHVRAPWHWVATVGADRAAVELVAAALWCVAAWLALGIGATIAAALPGLAGRVADRVARAVLPAAVHRLLAGSLSLGIVLAPVAAAAVTTAPQAAAAQLAAALPAPSWPTDPGLPAPSWPASPSPNPSTHGAQAAVRAAAHRRPGTHVVSPGDSLWLIAAARLGPRATAGQIAAAWPRWYAVNRTLIGPDPGLLVPGQVLHAPEPS